MSVRFPTAGTWSSSQWRPDNEFETDRVWIPGFMLGLAFASAAYAKLTDGGLAWITSGAVKYHFIDDAATAPLTWGLWVAAHPPAAVLLSLGAILTEACFISIIFVRSPGYRLLLGGVGLSLTVGFYVFQGVLWPAWLMLFTALLPWPLLDRGAEASALVSNTAPLRVRHVLLLVALAGQQALVSVSAVSVQPVRLEFVVRPPLGAGPSPGSGRSNGHCAARLRRHATLPQSWIQREDWEFETHRRRGARDSGAGRVRAPAGRLRLCVLLQVGDQLVPGLEQFLFVDDVVAVEDGAGLVAGQEHGDGHCQVAVATGKVGR